MSKSQDKRINVQQGRDMFAVSDDRLEQVLTRHRDFREMGCSNDNKGFLCFDEEEIVAKELLQLRKDNASLQMQLDISQENLGDVMKENRINVERIEKWEAAVSKMDSTTR